MFASLMYPMSKTNISVETVIGSPAIIIKLLGKHPITSTGGWWRRENCFELVIHQ